MTPAVAVENEFFDDDAAAGVWMGVRSLVFTRRRMESDSRRHIILLEPECVTRFKQDSNQPVLDLLKRFNMGWLHGLPELKPDHVQSEPHSFCGTA